ncbi:MAG: rubrerythrin family protein [Natronomonas sp.]
MDAMDILEAVRSDNDTALSRLGSSKGLYADTEGEMQSDAVLAAAADAEAAAAETFESWAQEESGAVAEAFAATAEEEHGHYETVLGKLDEHDPGDVPAIQTYLRGLTDTPERIGGFIGRTVAAERSKHQLTGFFVGKADPQTAQLFRDMGDELDAQLERGVELFETLDDEGQTRAKAAADEAIQTAYEEYTTRLESMGVDPKPVC